MPIPLTTELVDHAISKMFVANTDGGDIPVQMPSGIQLGDELIAFIMAGPNLNVVDISGPSGWTGGLSTGVFWKTADGSEDGAVIHWTTQDTRAVFEAPAVDRPVVAAVMCYRFSVPMQSRFYFTEYNSGGGSATADDIPQTGIVGSTQFRVYCATASGVNPDLSAVAASAIDWTNATDETGLQTEDTVSVSVADAFYDFPPPFAVYNPHDAVTAFSSAASTGMFLASIVFNFPYDCDNNTGGGPLVGYEITSTVITQGGTADIKMPANVQAGDYLVLFQGNINANLIQTSEIGAPAGWHHVWGQTNDYEWYKIADGTEGGTTVHFPLNSPFPAGGTTRAWVAGVLQYRFTEAPSAIQSIGTNLNFSNNGGSASSGTYGPFYVGGGASELRIYGFLGFGTADFNPVPITDSTWTNAVKRTPIVNAETSLTSGFEHMSFQMADIIDLHSSSQRVQLTINSSGDAAGGTGADLFGIRFIFAKSPCLARLLAYWGINATPA